MATTNCGGQGEFTTQMLADASQKLLRSRGSNSITMPCTSSKSEHSDAPNHRSNLIIDAAQAHWHLDLLGRNERVTNIRMVPHKGMRSSAFNGIFGPDLERAQQFQRRGYGVHIQPNPGGTLANEVTAGVALFYEHDDIPKQEQEKIWERFDLPMPTFQSDTGGKSIHNWFVFINPIEIPHWIQLMDRLIALVGSDRSCKGANRMMRMAGSWYISRTGEANNRCEIINATGQRYDAKLFDKLLPSLPITKPRSRILNRHTPSELKNLRHICKALQHIPKRVGGTGSYAEYRNLLWGLIDAVAEAGYSLDVAIELMEDHSPSRSCGWDIRQVARSGSGEIGAGTFWWQARQHGWEASHA